MVQRGRQIDPHNDPHIVESLSILDALDAKASGLGGILGLIFASNMVLVGDLSRGAGLESAVLMFALTGLAVQLAALTFAASCLVLMNEKQRDLLPVKDRDDAAEAVNHFVTVTRRRTRRYFCALVLTFASIALLALSIAGYAVIKFG